MKETEGDNLFLELILEGLTLIENKWEKLIDKWKLNVVTDRDTKRCSIHNDEYSICMTGESEEILLDEYRKDEPQIEKLKFDKPINSAILTIGDKIETKTMLYFLKDLMGTIYETDDIDITIHINDIKNTMHPNWLVDRMIGK